MLFQQIETSNLFTHQPSMELFYQINGLPPLTGRPKIFQESISPSIVPIWSSISPTPVVPTTTLSNTAICSGTPRKIFRPWDDDSEEENNPISTKCSRSRNSSFLVQISQKIDFPLKMPLGAPSSACGASIVPCQNDHHEKLAIENLATNLGKTMDGTHHRCIYCGKIYSRKYGLKIHLRTHTGFRPLKCKFCARPFGDPSNLNKHTRLHVESGDLNCAAVYPCHVCKKSWSRKRDLERHLVSRHSHPKNLVCNTVS